MNVEFAAETAVNSTCAVPGAAGGVDFTAVPAVDPTFAPGFLVDRASSPRSAARDSSPHPGGPGRHAVQTPVTIRHYGRCAAGATALPKAAS